TNIAGQKTDGVMKEMVTHEAKILPDGETIITLTIAREHTGKKGDLFSGVRNVNYLRVYVPLGSTLIDAGGFSPPDPKLFKFADPRAEPDPMIHEQETNARTERQSG